MTWLNREQLLAAWRRVRAAVFDPERIRRMVTYNFGLKLLSVLPESSS